MKLVIVFVCAIGLASCFDVHTHKKTAAKDLGDIVGELGACVNAEAIQNWVIEKWTSDEDFQKVVQYLQSDHFKTIDEHVFANKWINNHLVYLENNGVKVYETLNALREFLGLPPLEKPKALMAIMRKITSVMPPPDIEWDLLHLFIEFWQLTKGSIVCVLETLYKYHKDPALEDLLKQFEDPAFKEFLDYVWEKQEVKELFELIQKGNLDLEYIVGAVQRLLGLACTDSTSFNKSHRPMPLRLAQMVAKYQN